MRPLHGPAALSALVILLGACAPAPSDEPAIDLAAERSSLLAADEAWADDYAASDSPPDAFVAPLLPTAHLLPPGAPVANGQEAIRGVIEELESTPGFSVRWTPTLAEVSERADLGYTTGTYVMRLDGADGESLRIDGKYTTVWKKQEDGGWLVALDMFNADGPPQPAEESTQ